MTSFMIHEYEVKYEKTRKRVVPDMGELVTTDQAKRLASFLLANEPYEKLIVIGISGTGIAGYNVSSTGTANRSNVYLRNIFHFLCQVNATGFIIAHNHPSGTLKPSECDLAMTRAIGQMGRMVNIELLDHIIVTRTDTSSLRNELGMFW